MSSSTALPAASIVTKTTCPYCGTGCGVDVRVDISGKVEVTGDEQHPTNAGRLCVKGSALGDTVVPQGRLLFPKMRSAEYGVRSEPLQRVSWDTALDTVARRFQSIIDEHGPGAVAWYVSGQLLTEDYYVANKLVKGFIGTANIDTNSRLCMSSAVAGHKRAFGEDIVPVAYDDLEKADLVVLVGSNTAWCHPILFQRITREKERRPQMKLVVIDPRRTATTEMADLHLPLAAGSDVWLFNGLLSFLHRQGAVDTAFVEAHTTQLDATLAVADESAGDAAAVAERCGIEPELLDEFYQLFAGTEKVITCFSMGVNQSSAGTDKVNSIINCHLLSGRIGKPGMGPFSLTGQPNAMGGREVGGLANMLAAHMELDKPADRDRVQRFWNSPRIADKPGLKAIDLFNVMEEGRIKAVWIIATNPVVSLPDADQVKRALEKCEFVVVSEVIERTDTTAYADLLLPALGWGEKDGTVTNSERCISRQRAFLPALGEARADWWMLSQVAQRWGHKEHFSYQSSRDVFDEHARLSAFDNAGTRYFDIGGLAGLSNADYDALPPTRWPVRAQTEASAQAAVLQVFADGRFYHPDHRARFVPVKPRPPVHKTSEDYPLVLNTGRVRDHWHTMTRTGLSPRLASHIDEPFVDINPYDALLYGVRENELARVHSKWGSCVVRVRTSSEMPRGTVFVPIHWTAQFSSDARVGALVNPEVDPVSGEPEFKHTPVQVEPFVVGWYGFILSRSDGAEQRRDLFDRCAWWTRVTGTEFTRFEIAGRNPDADWTAFARAVLGATDPEAHWLEYEDHAAGIFRAAHVVNDRMEGCAFISRRPDLPSRAWLSSLFLKERMDEADRVGLLVGEPMNAGADTGPTICSCFGVGRNTIVDAIRTQKLTTTAQVTACVKAGGNCGSCVPELRKLIALCIADTESRSLPAL